MFNKINGIKLYREPRNSKSNYWLQTIILNKNISYLKNEILRACHKNLILARPTWKLISELKPYKKKQRMNLSGAKDIYNRVINLPSSQNLIIK